MTSSSSNKASVLYINFILQITKTAELNIIIITLSGFHKIGNLQDKSEENLEPINVTEIPEPHFL